MGNLLKIINRNFDFLFRGKALGFFDKIKLKLTPRYKRGHVFFKSKKIFFTDASSFVSTYEEIFMKNIYAFRSDTNSPLIVDCGANIGLSIIFFKSIFPNSKIIGFEPDLEIFKILQTNINNLSLGNIELHQKAVWKSNEDLLFKSQGGLSGSLTSQEGGVGTIKVKAFRLKELLNQSIDFLKIDIEGAEFDVIKDCTDDLINVKNLFIEYHSFDGTQQNLHEILRIVQKAGFRYHIHEATSTISPSPFIEINSIQAMDLQLNIFAYRV